MANTTNAIKKALRNAFPGTDFAVSTRPTQEKIEWFGGASIAEVKSVVVSVDSGMNWDYMYRRIDVPQTSVNDDVIETSVNAPNTETIKTVSEADTKIDLLKTYLMENISSLEPQELVFIQTEIKNLTEQKDELVKRQNIDTLKDLPLQSTGYLNAYDLKRALTILEESAKAVAKQICDDHGVVLEIDDNVPLESVSFTTKGITPDYVYFTISARFINKIASWDNILDEMLHKTRFQLIGEKMMLGTHWVGQFKVSTLNDYRTANKIDVSL